MPKQSPDQRGEGAKGAAPQLAHVDTQRPQPRAEQHQPGEQPSQGHALLSGAHALAMALRPDIQPQAALAEIVQQGYDTDTVATICDSLLGARFGCAWIPVERLLDCRRLTAYADALVMRSGLTQDTPEFLRRVAQLTTNEQTFQTQLRHELMSET